MVRAAAVNEARPSAWQSALWTRMLGFLWSLRLFTVVPCPPRSESYFAARRSHLQQTRRSVVRPHESGSLIRSCPFWHPLTPEKKQPQPPGTQQASPGRLTGADARLSVKRCLPSRERCPTCVAARKVCKDHFTFLFVRNESGQAVSLKARGWKSAFCMLWLTSMVQRHHCEPKSWEDKNQLLDLALFDRNFASSMTALESPDQGTNLCSLPEHFDISIQCDLPPNTEKSVWIRGITSEREARGTNPVMEVIRM